MDTKEDLGIWVNEKRSVSWFCSFLCGNSGSQKEDFVIEGLIPEKVDLARRLPGCAENSGLQDY